VCPSIYRKEISFQKTAASKSPIPFSDTNSRSSSRNGGCPPFKRFASRKHARGPYRDQDTKRNPSAVECPPSARFWPKVEELCNLFDVSEDASFFREKTWSFSQTPPFPPVFLFPPSRITPLNAIGSFYETLPPPTGGLVRDRVQTPKQRHKRPKIDPQDPRSFLSQVHKSISSGSKETKTPPPSPISPVSVPRLTRRRTFSLPLNQGQTVQIRRPELILQFPYLRPLRCTQETLYVAPVNKSRETKFSKRKKVRAWTLLA